MGLWVAKLAVSFIEKLTRKKTILYIGLARSEIASLWFSRNGPYLS